MLGLAWFVLTLSARPLPPLVLGIICASVAFGAFLAVLPFILEYRIAFKLAEADALTSVVAQVQNLEGIAGQISLATGQWQTVQEHSGKTVAAAKEIGERMASEAKAFAEFMRKSNDTEKSTLRLEVEKLHRSETEWLQVIVRILDHTFALHAAAVRSGKAALIEQLTQFQNAQRDCARRVGLSAIAPAPGEPFDAAKHQTANDTKPEADTAIGEIVATGYTFRSQLVRPALVTLKSSVAKPAAEPAATPTHDEEPTLL